MSIPDRRSHLLKRFPNWINPQQTPQRAALLSKIRDRRTCGEEFVFYSNRLFRLLIEDALNELPFDEITVTTPVGVESEGLNFKSSICGVSIMRAGESMEVALRSVCRGCRIGKILIQRDEKTLLPRLLYHNMPADIKQRHVLLMDPMLGTGGSAIKAIEVLTEIYGVSQDSIVFLNLVCVETGLEKVFGRFPNIKIVSAVCDEALDPKTGFIVPGIGDFGDRYFGTL